MLYLSISLHQYIYIRKICYIKSGYMAADSNVSSEIITGWSLNALDNLIYRQCLKGHVSITYQC